ncbi:acyl-coenzyme A synthetase ACSM5, mitochondrial-like isoform 1-T3 [Salvelinus alpinus]
MPWPLSAPAYSTNCWCPPTKREGWMKFGDLVRNASSDHECAETRRYDPMTIFCTSGTTGSPKMTQHSRSSYGIGLTVNGRYWSGLTERDALWNMLGQVCLEQCLRSLGVFIHEMPRFNSHTVLEVLIAGTFTGTTIKAGSFGKASPAYDKRVVDEAGSVLANGVEGNLFPLY